MVNKYWQRWGKRVIDERGMLIIQNPVLLSLCIPKCTYMWIMHVIRFCSHYHVLRIHISYSPYRSSTTTKWHSLWKIIINKCGWDVCNMSTWLQVYSTMAHSRRTASHSLKWARNFKLRFERCCVAYNVTPHI